MATVTRSAPTKHPKPGSRLRRGRPARDVQTRTALERECQSLRTLCASLRDRADGAERLHRELLSVLSHDVRNPLSVILVSSRLLDRVCGQDPSVRRQLDAVSRAADEINRMVQDLLDAASIEAGNFRVLDSQPSDVAPIVKRAYDSALPIAATKPLVLTAEIAHDIPPVLCEPERIYQVLGHLVGNAMRFTPKGGAISIRADAVDGHARFAVTDTGPGIAEEERTLSLIRREQGKRQVSQGAGLAVFVARGIVEAHGGTMWVESTVGQGATFYFTVPIAGVDLDTPDVRA